MHATLNHPDPAAQYGFYEGVPPKRLIAWLIDIAITALIALPFMLPFLMTAFLIVSLFALPVIWALVGFFLSLDHIGKRIGHMGHAPYGD